MEEKPKLNITPKESPKLSIKEIFPLKIRTMVEKNNSVTLKVDPRFGQNWNLSNLSIDDVYYFGNAFYKDRNNKEVSDAIDTFYQTLLRINPELQYINVENRERVLDVIRGVGSGLHINDIKYFVEELKGDAKNESEKTAVLETKAMEAYLKNHGVDTKKDETEFTSEELIRIDDLLDQIGFAFSPETIDRIIQNNPYQ